MEGQEGPIQPKEYPPIQNKYLTLFEHRFIGGSEESGGKFYDIPTFERDYIDGKGVLPPEYSQTLAEIRDKEKVEDIEAIRRGHYIIGTPSVFGASAIDVWEEGYDIGIELPENGSINEAWRVFLIPNNSDRSISELEALSKLNFSGRLAKFLKLEPGEGKMLMRLKTWEEYNEI